MKSGKIPHVKYYNNAVIPVWLKSNDYKSDKKRNEKRRI